MTNSLLWGSSPLVRQRTDIDLRLRLRQVGGRAEEQRRSVGQTRKEGAAIPRRGWVHGKRRGRGVDFPCFAPTTKTQARKAKNVVLTTVLLCDGDAATKQGKSTRAAGTTHLNSRVASLSYLASQNEQNWLAATDLSALRLTPREQMGGGERERKR